ncbi:hypothetical protein G6F57_008433 [Rhizopus arrhizus]|nr:hypothetical protein G6F23_008781 [Rhizopus arrhizus]KAG1416159.1 hypothetical protein G6F58_006106 [Rhizopus delemar]KAG0763432.1 hypothetical protein G6F24_006021 [Rhizopus arrhizus]KAG0785442.1 hypothetical protein G6F21_009256 [Rhizopus arrhizus]KAG0799776.1 hypothetical protein G6F22_002893 [Rhizopus arrhizus]
MSERQSKSTQDKHERILNELAKKPGNDLCADCGTKNPRWASYSLGVFLCIRCAGIHRKMGTHISKIKSITMDQWSSEQIEMMRNSGGNTTVNSIVNPSNHSMPIASDDDHSLEKYIRAKWEKRLFMTPKKVTSAMIQTPPKRSSSVPICMQPKDDVLIQTSSIHQQSPILINHQQQAVLTEEQKIDQLVKLGFTDKSMNIDALRRAGGNVDIATTVLNEARTNNMFAQNNLFSPQQSMGFAPQQQIVNKGFSQQPQQPVNLGFNQQQQQQQQQTPQIASAAFNPQQQQSTHTGFTQQQQQSQQLMNTTFTHQPQQMVNASFAHQQTNAPFPVQQTATFPFAAQQQNINSPFAQQQQQQQPNVTAPSVSINVNDPFGLTSNHFAGIQSNNMPSASTAFNPMINNNIFQQPQTAPSSPFQHPAATSNPFSQTNGSFNISKFLDAK